MAGTESLQHSNQAGYMVFIKTTADRSRLISGAQVLTKKCPVAARNSTNASKKRICTFTVVLFLAQRWRTQRCGTDSNQTTYPPLKLDNVPIGPVSFGCRHSRDVLLVVHEVPQQRHKSGRVTVHLTGSKTKQSLVQNSHSLSQNKRASHIDMRLTVLLECSDTAQQN